MRLIDIGANLTDPMFRGIYRGKRAHENDYSLMLQRAKDAGVSKMIITGGSLSDAKEAIALAQEFPDTLYATVGCHPTRCQDFEKDKEGPDAYLEKLRQTIQSAQGTVVAIGECGLDYDRLHFCPKEVQKRYFEAQFTLAQEFDLPMFLHDRNTGGDFYTMVNTHRHAMPRGGVVHSFTGSLEEMNQYIELGLSIGINGCSLKTAENLKVVKAIPLDRLMLETDAPWCEIRPTHASHPYLSNMSSDEQLVYRPDEKKKEKFVMGSTVKSRCEPCHIGQVLHVVAGLHEQDPHTLAETIWQNTCAMFFPKEQ